jgi:hypothetical protein
VSTHSFLGEHQLAVDRHLEKTSGRLDQADLGFGKGLFQLSRQTGGSRLVVSDNAILDRHMHSRDHPFGLESEDRRES